MISCHASGGVLRNGHITASFGDSSSTQATGHVVWYFILQSYLIFVPRNIVRINESSGLLNQFVHERQHFFPDLALIFVRISNSE